MPQVMNNYKANFQNCTSEYLLKKRAMGAELDEAAHLAIEEIFRERGETLPPRPSRPIDRAELRGLASGRGRGDQVLGVIAVVLAMIVSQLVAKTIGLLVLLVYAIYWGFKWFKRRGQTEAERAHERETRQVEKEGLSELMVAAANGDLMRVKELIAYGADVNQRTIKDATALIYAARNNQLETVRALLAAGADVNVRFEKGETAVQVAKRYGYQDIVQAIESRG